MFKKILILMLILVIIPFAYAKFNYSELGNFDGYYQQGTGFFNENLGFDINTDGSTRSLSDGKKTPLVQDLDGDGQNEIIVLDDFTLKIYQGIDLVLNGTYSIFGSSGSYSNMIIYDIDDDGYQEIIIADMDTSSEYLHIIEFNGSGQFTNQTSFNYTSLDHGLSQGQIVLKCADTNKCLMAYFSRGIAGGGGNFMHSVSFNSTHLSPESANMMPEAGGGVITCFPLIPNMVYEDYDQDGISEYIISGYRIDGSPGSERVFIDYILAENISVAPVRELEISINIGDWRGGELDSCLDSAQGRLVTNPLVFDAETGGDLETIIGFMNDGDEFEMRSYDSAGNELDTYPELFDADGVLISNIIRTNVFDSNSFCVLGFEAGENEIDLLCASMTTGETPQTREFKLDTDNLWNTTGVYDNHYTLIHSAQHSTVTTDGSNIDEIISNYGVFRVDWDTTHTIQLGANILSLEHIFVSPLINATYISVDYEKVGREDLIALQKNNIWYLDDDFSFSGAFISNYIINPCIDATWKVSDANDDNITRNVEVRITPEDVDGNSVMARSSLYYGKSFNQTSDWSNLASSGTIFVFSHVINETISSGTLRLETNDTSNPSEIDIIDLSISVSTSGVEQDDCITTVTPIVPPEPVPEPDPTIINNTITNSINDLKGVLNLNLTNDIIWLLIMAVVGGMLAYAGFANHTNPQVVLAVVGIVETILFIIGVQLGFMSIIWLFVTVIIAIGIIGFKLRQVAVGG